MIQRKRKIRIVGTTKDDGVSITVPKELNVEIVSYFQNLLQPAGDQNDLCSDGLSWYYANHLNEAQWHS